MGAGRPEQACDAGNHVSKCSLFIGGGEHRIGLNRHQLPAPCLISSTVPQRSVRCARF
jgi:hypothetical protein